LQDQEIGIISEDFRATEQEIVNKTLLANQFFDKLVKQLELGLEDIAAQYSAASL
jgi:hypothetical protein